MLACGLRNLLPQPKLSCPYTVQKVLSCRLLLLKRFLQPLNNQLVFNLHTNLLSGILCMFRRDELRLFVLESRVVQCGLALNILWVLFNACRSTLRPMSHCWAAESTVLRQWSSRTACLDCSLASLRLKLVMVSPPSAPMQGLEPRFSSVSFSESRSALFVAVIPSCKQGFRCKPSSICTKANFSAAQLVATAAATECKLWSDATVVSHWEFKNPETKKLDSIFPHNEVSMYHADRCALAYPNPCCCSTVNLTPLGWHRESTVKQWMPSFLPYDCKRRGCQHLFETEINERGRSE